MRLIVGLGNPGPKYTFTRHNVGWLVVDQMVSQESCGTPEMRHKAMFWGPIVLHGQRSLILKPLTYMNLSGLAVLSAVSSFAISLEDILVVYDDMALPFGDTRLRAKGSSAGHKGIQSIINTLGSENIPRLRIGIGSPVKDDNVDHVLSNFNKEEQALLPDVIEKACSGIRIWLQHDIQKAMNTVNSQSALQEAP